MAVTTASRLILITANNCSHGCPAMMEIWTQLTRDPNISSQFQFQLIIGDNCRNRLSPGPYPMQLIQLHHWYPTLMVIPTDTWNQALTNPQLLVSEVLVFNGESTIMEDFQKYTLMPSGDVIGEDPIRYVRLNPAKTYPLTYSGVLTWLRHCHHINPTIYPEITTSSRELCLRQISEIAPQFTLSPFWAAAYQNRDLPFLQESRKVVGSSYLEELTKRRHHMNELTGPEKLFMSKDQIHLIVTELEMLGLTETSTVNQSPPNWRGLSRQIQGHLELLIQRYMI
jgi:hypothetical protein